MMLILESLRTLFITGLIIISSLSHSGEGGAESGGGGGVLICGENYSLLDLEEGKSFYGYDIPLTDESYRDQIEQRLLELERVDSDLTQVLRDKLESILSSVNGLESNMEVKFISEDLPFESLPQSWIDLGDVRLLRKNEFKDCYIQYGAWFFDGENPELHISEFVFNRFTETEKAALLFHEAIYYIARTKRDEEYSETTRHIVAQIFGGQYELAIRYLKYFYSWNTLSFPPAVSSPKNETEIGEPELSENQSMVFNLKALGNQTLRDCMGDPRLTVVVKYCQEYRYFTEIGAREEDEVCVKKEFDHTPIPRATYVEVDEILSVDRADQEEMKRKLQRKTRRIDSPTLRFGIPYYSLNLKKKGRLCQVVTYSGQEGISFSMLPKKRISSEVLKEYGKIETQLLILGDDDYYKQVYGKSYYMMMQAAGFDTSLGFSNGAITFDPLGANAFGLRAVIEAKLEQN